MAKDPVCDMQVDEKAAAYVANCIYPPLYESAIVDKMRDRPPGHSLLHDRSHVVCLSVGIQHERRGVGRHHRVGRSGC